MNSNKISAEDQIVFEHLQHMDLPLFNLLAFTSRQLISNRRPGAAADWNYVWCNLIEKVRFPKYVQQFRPITILSAIQKLYLSCVLELAKMHTLPSHAAQHAFRPKYCTLEIIHILRSLVEKSREWQEYIFIGDGDIAKAYDNTTHSTTIQGLIRKQCPRDLTAAMARWWKSRVRFKLAILLPILYPRVKLLCRGTRVHHFVLTTR